MIPSIHGRLKDVKELARGCDLNPHLCDCDYRAHTVAFCSCHPVTLSVHPRRTPAAAQLPPLTLPLWAAQCTVCAARCILLNSDTLLISQALSQLLCLLPWPWWRPPSVVSPGLPQPMQSPATPAEGLSGALFGAYPLPTFKFQPRSESVDWRRISALDMDRVARELDVATLQENIAGVTFCNLDREVCSRCGQPVDPVLLKVLRLAQLIIEYLLHCQDCLSASVAQLEARLQASLGQQQRGQQELGRQADELKGVREESRRRRKMISTLQQLLLQTGAHSYHAVRNQCGAGEGRDVSCHRATWGTPPSWALGLLWATLTGARSRC